MTTRQQTVCRTLFLAALGAALFLTLVPTSALACGCSYAGGSPGGQEFVPQSRDSSNALSQNSIISRDRALQIASEYTLSMNPEFEVSGLNDLGGFYEAEIVSQDGEIVQLLGIDKFSGQLQVIE
mgnify:CR=1 FL=1